MSRPRRRHSSPRRGSRRAAATADDPCPTLRCRRKTILRPPPHYPGLTKAGAPESAPGRRRRRATLYSPTFFTVNLFPSPPRKHYGMPISTKGPRLQRHSRRSGPTGPAFVWPEDRLRTAKSRNPGSWLDRWVPAFAGTTIKVREMKCAHARALFRGEDGTGDWTRTGDAL